MAFNRLNVIIGAKLEGFEKSLKQMERSLAGFSRNMQRIGDNLTKSVTLPVAGLGVAAAKSFAETEKLQMALTAVMKDSGAAAAEMDKLRKVAQAPGLAFDQAVKASARLQAVGLNADQAREVISQFGNAVARSGGGAVELDGAVLALTQIASKGKISAEEINQLNERIFEIRPALEKAFGTSNSEELQKLGISSEEFIAKVTQEFSKLERVNGGLANSFENFKSSAQESLATLGAEINKVFNLQGAIDDLAKKLAGAVEWFKGLDDSTKKTILTVAGVTAAIGPALLIIGKLSSVAELAVKGFKNLYGGVRLLTAGFGFLVSPIGLAVGAFAAIAAGVIIAYNKFEGFRRGVNAVIDVTMEMVKIFKEGFAALLKGFAELKEGNFKAAAKSFGEAITKTNPVGIALTQGKRLGQAFSDGFADDSNRLEGALNNLKNKFKSTTQAISSSVGSVISGGNVFGDNFQRPGASGGTGGGSGGSAAAQAARSPALQEFATIATTAIGPVKLLNEETGLFNANLTELGAKVSSLPGLFTRTQEAAMNARQAFTDFSANITGAVNNALTGLGVALGEALGDLAAGSGSLRGIGDVIAQLMATVGQAAIALGVQLLAVKLAVKSFNPILAIAGGIALIAASKLFKSKLDKSAKLAKGGIVPEGFPNDSFPAMLTSGEAVIPAKKLPNLAMNSGGSMVVIPDVRIEGQDIVISFTRAATNMNRSGDLGQLKALLR